jgi:hypothetical protein
MRSSTAVHGHGHALLEGGGSHGRSRRGGAGRTGEVWRQESGARWGAGASGSHRVGERNFEI